AHGHVLAYTIICHTSNAGTAGPAPAGIAGDREHSPSNRGDEAMKYFMDTHDRAKGSWPRDDISEEEFLDIYAEFGRAVAEQGGHDLGGQLNVPAGRAFCFTYGPDEDAIRRAHESCIFRTTRSPRCSGSPGSICGRRHGRECDSRGLAALASPPHLAARP